MKKRMLAIVLAGAVFLNSGGFTSMAADLSLSRSLSSASQMQQEKMGDNNTEQSNDKSTPVYYMVSFDANGTDVIMPEAVSVREGEAISRPKDPVRTGYVFEGWYQDNRFIQEYDFQEEVSEPVTLYAKWGRPDPDISIAPDTEYRVSFVLNDGTEGIYETKTVTINERVTAPAKPVRNLYAFTGWYTDPGATEKYDFSTPVRGETILYAGWGDPDGGEGVYSAISGGGTIYSITDILMSESKDQVNVTVNTESSSALIVEFLEVSEKFQISEGSEETDTSDDTENTEEESETVLYTTATRTPDYCELETLPIPIGETLPDYFIIRATLVDEDNQTLCEPYTTIKYTQMYEEFEQQTTDDFVSEPNTVVINFDGDKTTNFGVLADGVVIVESSETFNTLTVEEIEKPASSENNANEDVVLENNGAEYRYIFTNCNDTVSTLKEGDRVYIKDTQYLFKIGSIDISTAGQIVFTANTQDNELTEFYDVLKVDSSVAVGEEENGIQPMLEIVDEDWTKKVSLGEKIEWKPNSKFKVTGSLNGTIEVEISIAYDVHLFKDNYFECSVITTNELKLSVDAEYTFADREHFSEKNELKFAEITIPTSIPGLAVFVKPVVLMDWSVKGGGSLKWTSKQKSGFKYNTNSGKQTVDEKETTTKLSVEGEVEIKLGPQVSLGVKFLETVLKAEVSAGAGMKITATITAGHEWTDAESKHACAVCVDGNAKWYIEVKAKLTYGIKKKNGKVVLGGTPIDATLVNIEGDVKFLPKYPAQFHISLINDADSKYEGKVTFGGGPCENKSWKTTFVVKDEENNTVTGNEVIIHKQDGTEVASGTATCDKYLYNGIYIASAEIDGTISRKSFVVSEKAQTVNLKADSGNGELIGTVIDSDTNSAIEGATIKAFQGDLTIATQTSGPDGKFNLSLPEGEYDIEVSKDDYVPYTGTETMGNAEIKYLETVKLVPGEGKGGFSGQIINAVTGSPVEGVALKLRKGWNAPAEEMVIKTLTSDSDGRFKYDIIKMFDHVVFGLDSGNYTLTASKEGFVTNSFNITVRPGIVNENQNGTISPALAEGDYRIVLEWGTDPRDLDSHMVGPLSNGGTFHVYFSDKSQYDNGKEICNLDWDDTDGEGPETITLNTNSAGPYYYYIYRYAGSGTVAASGAKITVYAGDSVRTFNVPTDQGSGDYWNVFAIVNGQLIVRNTMTSSAELSYANIGTGSGGGGGTSFRIDRSMQYSTEAEDNEPKGQTQE